MPLATTEEQQQRRDESRRQLREAVAEMMSEEGFQRWLTTRAKFHRYSAGNTFLIACQRHDATMVAGYQAWRKDHGRQVRKGEKAIRILAPIVVKKRDDESGEYAKAVVGFRSACVFDVAQTEGEPLPEPPAPVDAEGEELAGLLPKLEGLAREIGFVVYYYEPEEPGLYGFCDQQGKRIVVRASLPANARVTTLVHEIAHALGLTYRDYSRRQCETIVEATTYIVLGSIGYDTAGFSVPYVATFARDDDGLAALERFAKVIDETARRIEKALGVSSVA